MFDLKINGSKCHLSHLVSPQSFFFGAIHSYTHRTERTLFN